MAGLPPTWAVVIAILTLLFGGVGGVFWMLRREIRESRLAPANEEQMRLENERLAAEISNMLREAQKEAVAEMKGLLEEARVEISSLRKLVVRMQASQARFRARVEDLLRHHNIAIPEWWHEEE